MSHAVSPIAIALALAYCGFAQDTKHILIGEELEEGFDLGLNTNKDRNDWFQKVDKAFRLEYPAGQKWGAMFITVGPPGDPPHPFIDLSQYGFLVIEMRGGAGGEKVQIGIKTNTQPDNGGETKITETLAAEWKTYRYALGRFVRTDPSKLYVVAEFVFSGPQPQIVFVKSVRYAK